MASAALALLAAQSVSAAGSGSFTPTGPMGGPRVFHAAAPLPDGRVLVVGGSVDGASGPGGLATTEIFSPATGNFAPGPSMGVIRNGPVAAPLKDGRVLVAGGRGPLSSAQIYDPATNTFSGTGIMQDARESAAAVTLPDGRVLVMGGFDGTYLDTAEIWDPATNLWTPTNSMRDQRAYPGAAPLPDGRVLVAGGYDGGVLRSAEIYDPATGTFSSSGVGNVTPPVGHRGAGLAPLPDGRVLVAGGDVAGTALTFAEAFDAATLAFSPAGIGEMGTPHGFTAAVPLADGRVLVMGGLSDAGITAKAEIFAATNTFTYSLSGRRLLVTVKAAGTVELVAAPAGKGKPAAAKKPKRKALLRPASADGGPGTIEVPLLLTKAAKSRLKRSGKVKLPAQISFSPIGGLTASQTATLKLKLKRKP